MAEVGQSALSVRERQLLKLAAAGLTDTAISQKLHIGEASVSTYWRRIRAKLGPFSRTELVATLLRSECERIVSALIEENRKIVQKLRDENASQQQSNFYQRIVEHAADAIFVIAPDGTIEMVNESAAILFGWSQDELRGRHVSVLVPERFHSSHAVHIANYVASPSKKQMGSHLATPALHRSGAEFPIAANLSAVEEGDHASVICIVRSINLQ